MAIITYPLNNIEYTAEDAELYHATRTSGVFANDDFPITVSGDGNVVTIGEGIGWIRNSKFSGKVVANKAEMSLDLGLPHATYPRIDAVVLRFNANANASEIIVKNGTAKTNPTPPEVVRTESVYELHLYHIRRVAGAASISPSNVVDLREDRNYCGIMSDDVTILGENFVSKDMVGVAGGVASLNSSGQIPSAQIPSLNYIPTSQKGAANGVAPLDENSKISAEYFSTVTVKKGGTGATDASRACKNLGAHYLGISTEAATEKDLNNLKTPGCYSASTYNTTNLPPNWMQGGQLIVLSWSQNVVGGISLHTYVQIYRVAISGYLKEYSRCCVYSWTEWKETMSISTT